MLKYLQKFVITEEEIKAVEGKLTDYEDNIQLVEIIRTIFEFTKKQVDHAVSKPGYNIKNYKHHKFICFELSIYTDEKNNAALKAYIFQD